MFYTVKAYLKTRYWNHFISRARLEEWQDRQVRRHLQKNPAALFILSGTNQRVVMRRLEKFSNPRQDHDDGTL